MVHQFCPNNTNFFLTGGGGGGGGGGCTPPPPPYADGFRHVIQSHIKTFLIKGSCKLYKNQCLRVSNEIVPSLACHLTKQRGVP